MYIRSSISAQSCDSVPPAPAWIENQALFSSSGAPILTASSSSSPNAPAAAQRLAGVGLGGLALAQQLGERVELALRSSSSRSAVSSFFSWAARLAEDLLRLLRPRPEVGRGGFLPQSVERAPRGVEIKDSREAQ